MFDCVIKKMLQFFDYPIKKLFECQRGELELGLNDTDFGGSDGENGGEDDDDIHGEDLSEGIFNSGVDNEDLDSDQDDPNESDSDDDLDKKNKEDSALRSEFDQLKKKYESASAHIDNLNKAVSSLRRDKKNLSASLKKDDNDQTFSDAQLLGIIEENKDDPSVMFQAMKQLIKQSNTDLEQLTDNKVKIAQQKTEIDNLLTAGGWHDQIEKNRESIDKVIDFHGLKNHPHADFLALGGTMINSWPSIIKALKEEAKKQALGGLSEEARKKLIQKNKPTTNQNNARSDNENTPASWKEAADRLGLGAKQRKAYYNMMHKSSKKGGD